VIILEVFGFVDLSSEYVQVLWAVFRWKSYLAPALHLYLALSALLQGCYSMIRGAGIVSCVRILQVVVGALLWR
jgi:hypothetical protein